MDETQNTHNEDMTNEMINEQILSQLVSDQELIESEDSTEGQNLVCTDDEMLNELDDESESELVLSEEDAVYPGDEDLEYPNDEFQLEFDHLDDKDQEDKLWKARTGLNADSICGAIETIIFMSDKPVPLLKIRSLIDEDMPLRVIHEAIARLQREYEEAHHGIRMQEVAQGYQFRTKATYSKYVQDLLKVNELVLSPTALEVLAIIAYKQPVSKVEVEKIRGVDSSHIVRGLMDKRLVKVTGRSEEVGKPVLYGTTTEFLEVFNLANTDQLPPEHELEEIATQGVGKISDIRTLVNADIQSRFSTDEIDELDRISMEIKSIDSETQFTKSLKYEEKKRTREEGEVRKTAFDLLEEHLDLRLVQEANEASKDSEIFTAVTNPSVISDLTNGPFNIPDEEEEEEDDFQMIDLDTGEVILDEDMDDMIMIDIDMETGVIEGLPEGLNIELEIAEEEGSSLDETPVASSVKSAEEPETIELIGNHDDEAKNLADALDSAFAKLLGGDSPLDDLPLDTTEINDDIDQQTDRMVESAKDLDIDLSFMKNSDLDGFEDTL